MTTPLLAAAAAERAQHIRQRADRPSQRRCAEHPGARAAVRAALSGVQVREAGADGGLLEFTGRASVYEQAYEMWDMFGPYTEIVTEGAGSDSLARADLDVPLVLGHDQLRRMARTTTGTLFLTESADGLDVRAPALDPADHDVAYIAPKLRSGLVDEMSFAFRIESGQWSPDYTEYRINRYDIHRGDVAIVGYGANPYTGAAVRQPAATSANSRARALLELSIARA
ncbi:HK97 family phage prohead protease [Streptomyces acidiscabies]|uniref:HK97 family phage prohead protease n=2 Tax=Streptomyces acidiscabies TaxID=42234 RepID=A0AAP6BLQ5_9ACTN|nr:HK97 family phage prohead protease [Streptomyces acidiscabies]MBZ3918194.1 HK97 family phage prohead protease [Streptomyces acidiscabies]MDX2967124.1 HK97 family phage prohead protease [Streptomyces acidiscabies]MDX3788353.1 HK97 family phage prohead protease [Streptomyces acidiscabies]